MKLKKILLISARSDLGGGSRHLRDLLLSFKKFHDLEAYVASPNDLPFGPEYKQHAKKHISIPHRKFSIIAFFKLFAFCVSEQIDIVHSHGRGAGTYSRILNLFNFKTIHTFHGAHNDPSLIGKVKLFVDRLLRPLTDLFISVSESEKEKALSLNMAFDPIEVVPNGINFQELNNIPPADLHNLYDIPKDKKIWGTLSRISPEKGNHLLIDELIENNFETHYFLIAGDGPELNSLRSRLREKNINNVKFIGTTDDPIGFLKGINGYFSFSLGEGMPYSVLEALACGLPCVLSKVSGHLDFEDSTSLFDLKKKGSFFDALASAKPASTGCISAYSLENMAEKTRHAYLGL